MRRWLTVLGVCVGVTVAFAATASANVLKAIWGPSTLFASNGCTLHDGCSAFPIYRQLGVDVYQFQLHFNEIAPTPPANPRDPNDPAYHWPANADFVVNEAAANGITPAALIQFSPPWANGGRSAVWAADPTAFANFAYAASRRYPSIKIWMVEGEPMLGVDFQPMPPNSKVGPRTYGKILDATYAALKQASPSNLVVGGNTLSQAVGFPGGPAQFISWMRLKNGRMPRMDLLGHNPFELRFPNLQNGPLNGMYRGLSDIDTYHKELLKVYGKRVQPKKKHKGKKAVASRKRKRKRVKVPKFWLSEYTVVSDHPSANFGGTFFVSRDEQARWLSAAYALANSQQSYVAGLGWFTLLDQPEAPDSADWGLMQFDGTPKPSFSAYAAVP